MALARILGLWTMQIRRGWPQKHAQQWRVSGGCVFNSLRNMRRYEILQIAKL